MVLILLEVGECCSKKFVFWKNEEASYREAHERVNNKKWNSGTREPKNIEKAPKTLENKQLRDTTYLYLLFSFLKNTEQPEHWYRSLRKSRTYTVRKMAKNRNAVRTFGGGCSRARPRAPSGDRVSEGR
jgi:hypothetical protein